MRFESGIHSDLGKMVGGHVTARQTGHMSDMLWLELLALAGDEGTRNMTGESRICRGASQLRVGLETKWLRGKRRWECAWPRVCIACG